VSPWPGDRRGGNRVRRGGDGLPDTTIVVACGELFSRAWTPIDDALLGSLLAARQPAEIADIVVGACAAAVAIQAAGGIVSRVHDDPRDPEGLDDQIPGTDIIGE
jgi:hypothetical protein